MSWWVRGLEIAVLVQFVTFALHDTVPLGRWIIWRSSGGRFR
jgi:hypothetical protein